MHLLAYYLGFNALAFAAFALRGARRWRCGP